jgi:hypothetical protein
MELVSFSELTESMAQTARRTRDITLEQALFYVEWPAAAERDFPGKAPAAYRRMDAIFKEAEREQPLAWQAYKAKAANRPTVNVIDGARVFLAKRMAGAFTPPQDPPPTPEPSADAAVATVHHLP